MIHGNHWEAITGNAEESLERFVPATLANGALTEETQFVLTRDDGGEQPETVIGATYPETPLRCLALISTNSAEPGANRFLYSAYPFCAEGLPNNIEIDSLEADNIEGIVHGSCESGAAIDFFDPLFFLNRGKYEMGKTFEFSLAGLAYKLQKTTVDSIEVTEGPMIDMEKQRLLDENPNADVSNVTSVTVSLEGSCWLYPTKVPDDAEFRGVIEDVGYFELEDVGFYRAKITLVADDDHPLAILLYASELILNGYVPRKGDSVEGFVWLQGRLLET